MTAEPLGIEADRALGTVTIDWSDAHRSTLTASMLRWACPCAVCAGEWGRPGVLADLKSLAPDELTLVDLHAIGSYALAPVWASGHSSGIYSFDYLRSLCPCEACRGATRSVDYSDDIPAHE